MRFKTFQIVWHEKQPVFAVEFLSSDVFATGGADRAIRTWKVIGDGEDVEVEWELTGLGGAVNAIRLSPKGKAFASGGDKGEVIVWKCQSTEQPEGGKPWKPSAFLRGHANDVFDVCWSSDGTSLATASLEGVTIVWDIQKERPKVRLCDHRHYVQGVAWDPFHQFLVTQGGDRRCKVYVRSTESQTKKETAARTAAHWKLHKTLFKIVLNKDTDVSGEGTGQQKGFLFHDDTLTSFFRRLAWSPDGSFLVVPAGLRVQDGEPGSLMHVAYVYSRGKWSTPVACLPSVGEPFVIVRFCPRLFVRAPSEEEQPLADLPYQVLFACASLRNIYVYTSGRSLPVAVLSGLHYSEISDLAWSDDGSYLVVSSRDGFCSIVHFEPGDLGTPLDKAQLVQSDSQAAEWFTALEEIQHRYDNLPVKRRVQPQPIKQNNPDDMTVEENADQQPKKLIPAKKRIRPVAVDATEEQMPIPSFKSTEQIFSVKTTQHQLSDLQKLAEGAQTTTHQLSDIQMSSEDTQKQESKTTSFMDLLAMTQAYARDRFGSNT